MPAKGAPANDRRSKQTMQRARAKTRLRANPHPNDKQTCGAHQADDVNAPTRQGEAAVNRTNVCGAKLMD